MTRLASAAIAFVLAVPTVAFSQMIRGIGIDERLDQPSRFARAPEHVFVHLIVPRNAVETSSGSYAFAALDERLAVLEGSTVLLALEGMPASAEGARLWQDYVLAVAERYRGKVVGYVLGRGEGEAPSQIETYAYLLKLAAIQIRSVDPRVVLLEGDGRSHDPQWVDSLYEQDIAPYFAGIAVTADDDDDLSATVETVARRDPSAQVIVSGAPLNGSPSEISRRALLEVVSNLGQGSGATSFSGSDEAVVSLVSTASRLSNLLDGDVVAFDKGEAALDIKVSGRSVEGILHHLFFNADTGSTLLVYWAEPGTVIPDAVSIELRAFVPEAPTLHDPAGSATLPVGRFDYDPDLSLAKVRVPVFDRPLILEYPAPATGTTVTASVGLRVNEIIARHQQTQTQQDNLVESYFASVRDEIHFRPTAIDSFDVIM